MSTITTADTAAHLRVDGVSKSFGARRVLTDVGFIVSSGERAGLIGENGTGKSTLLAIVAGLLEPDAGAVTCTAPGGQVRMDLLHQQAPFDPAASVSAAVEAAVAPVRALAAAVETAGAALADHPADPSVAGRYDTALAVAVRADVWSLDARIAATLAGLGLGDIPSTRLAGQLSGGQRARLALACHLLSSPDVLLLDEPTNHLDDAATGFLVDTLRGWPGPVLVATEVVVRGRLPATSLSVSAREKWLVTGANGTGKSTLLQVLAGRLQPTSGTLTSPGRLRVGLLSQDGDLADPPDVLLLDEPTNHLSLYLAVELEAAIPDYPGAVIVASHDRWTRERWQGRRLSLD